MALDLQQIQRVAKLARLDVDPARAQRYAQELGAILELVDRLQAVDTSGVEPLLHPVGMVQRLRADVATESDHRAAFQAVAPAVDSGLYLVPKVIE
ncbi:MAG TPA: Asp-tRNA(Asn)/Glu-tRNA(Gln) amidotransferase subunit GatC [Nevskiaceae bacterium]